MWKSSPEKKRRRVCYAMISNSNRELSREFFQKALTSYKEGDFTKALYHINKSILINT